MDSFQKKKLDNEKRLLAIKEWQKHRVKNVQGSSANLDIKVPKQNKVITYDSDDETVVKNNQLKLFESEEEDENFSDCFKIRPQFEGRNGLRMLEMSSELSDRFKLDERFKEDEEIVDEEDFEDSEKNKNIRILESILGHEVSKKHPVSQNLRKKKEIERFDPEDDNNLSCIKNVEVSQKKPKAKKRKLEPEVTVEEIPISTERYIEVTSNLKDIMNTAGTFSFSEKFNTIVDSKDDTRNKDKIANNQSSIFQKEHSVKSNTLNKVLDETSLKNYESSSGFKDPFFISDSDPRLKEGIEFFKRPKLLDEIREEWNKKRDTVLEIFKRRRKSALRRFTRQPKKHSQRSKFSLKK